jgi:cbb3-type cytochrome oxidase subunit 3
MKNISSRNKGLLTGALMILISIAIYLAKNSFDNGLQYITYAVYIAGIIWTLLTFKKEAGNDATFKLYFAEGFKYFVVVTFLMVLFTLVFILLHPELKEQMAEAMRAAYAKDAKDMMPSDVENKIAAAKKFFLPGFLMGAVLSYLFTGALATAVTAAILKLKK